MRNVGIIMRRELASYFATPLAYVFIFIFLVLAAVFTFYLGGFYERGQADLEAFFSFHPWLYLFLIPALSMRLWAEERKSGSIELLMTQPVLLWDAVVGKFLAAWAFTTLALVLTFPIWVTVNYLGKPDNGAILAAYLGSAAARGRLPRDRLVHVGADPQPGGGLHPGRGGLLRVPARRLPHGARPVPRLGAAVTLVDAMASLSFLTHFESISKGVIDVRDLMYFAMLIGLFLLATTVVLELRKAE